MEMSSVQEFANRVRELKQNENLKDIKFYPGMISETVPEEFCLEANKLIEAIQSGKGRELKFNDSKRK